MAKYSDSDFRYIYGTDPAENAAILIQDWGVEVALQRAESAYENAAKDLDSVLAMNLSWMDRDAYYWEAIRDIIKGKA